MIRTSISKTTSSLFPASTPTVITVLGARSGTSALAGTLGLLGCTLPTKMMPANWANEKGYFEPQDLAELHDEILASVGSVWHDWREFPPCWFVSPEAVQARHKLATTYQRTYRETGLAVLKEPRMCRLLPLWHNVFNDLGANPAYCFIDRSPAEVAASLQARDGSTIDQGLSYYVRNHLDAERDTRGHRRTFIAYEDLLSDWQSTIAKATNSLGITLQPTAAQINEVDEFLERRLRHQTQPDLHPSEQDLHHIAAHVHYAFSDLGDDRNIKAAQQRLDDMRVAFNALSRRQGKS